MEEGKQDVSPEVVEEAEIVEAEEAVEEPKDAPSVAKKRGGFGVAFGLLTGGVLAAVIGFGAARYVVPEGWPFPGVTPEPNPLEISLSKQGEMLESLTARVVSLEVKEAKSAAESHAALLDLTEQLSTLEGRVLAVEKIAPEGSEAAVAAAAAYEAELAAMRAMLESELARIEAQKTGVEQSTKVAAARAALSGIQAAVASGRGFAAEIAALEESTTVPDALKIVSNKGVSTLSDLQERFPDMAREALSAATKAAVASGEVSRFTAFWQSQLGIRSLEPREGMDADAILSRAEGALREGDLAKTFVELDTLPAEGLAVFADWRKDAQARLSAVEAIARLSQELNSN